MKRYKLYEKVKMHTNQNILNNTLDAGDVYYKIYSRSLLKLAKRIFAYASNIKTAIKCTPNYFTFWGHTIILYDHNRLIGVIQEYAVDYMPLHDKKICAIIDSLFKKARRLPYESSNF